MLQLHEIQSHGIEYVDVTAAAKILGIAFATCQWYKAKGYLPEVEAEIGSTGFWKKTTIEEFARNRNTKRAPRIKNGKIKTTQNRRGKKEVNVPQV